MATTTKKYDSSSIKHLSGRDAVRQKLSMYIGPTDASGIFTLLREILDNVRDENLGGNCTLCDIYLDDDGSYHVIDDGRGMPIGPMKIKDSISGKTYTIPALQGITSLLHTGGKIEQDNSAYATSVGSHGIGQKATNFVSEWFEVSTFDRASGSWYFIGYKDGVLDKPMSKLKKAPTHPFRNRALTKGTVVSFKPDLSFFSDKKFSPAMIGEWATMAAYFTNKLKITLANYAGKERVYYSENGPLSYVEDKLTKLKCESLNDKSFVLRNDLLDVVFQFTNFDGCELQAFTNGLNNPEKGLHFTSFVSALHRSLEPYVKRKQEFTVSELKEGLVGLINVKLSAPKFASQTKEKLTDERAGKPVYEELFKALTDFFKKNKALAEKVCARAHELKTLKSQFTASKKTLTELKKSAKKGLPAKATLAPNCKVEDRVLYLVEGESAGGSAREARDPRFHELLPLKGKVMNALKADGEKALLSEEVLHALNMIGFNPSKTDPLSSLRVGKIVLLADPDPDGPLAFETPIVVEDNGVFKNLKLQEVVNMLEQGQPVFVLTWTGKAFKKAQAYLALKAEVNNLIKVKFKDFSVTCTPEHKWPVVSSRGVSWVPANELKAGLRIAGHPKFEKDELKSLVGHSQLSGEFIIASVKPKRATTQVACLTVPQYHNFLTGYGVLSSNCHINSLILALFYKFLPQLFDRGIVHVVDSPEYYEISGEHLVTGSTAQEVQAKLDSLKLKGQPHHIKGWGEISPTALERLAFSSESRLIRIKPIETEHGVEFVKLMGTGVEARKALLGIE